MASCFIMEGDGGFRHSVLVRPWRGRVCAALLSHIVAMANDDAMPHWEEFYLGSRRFQFIADNLGMPIDQVTSMTLRMTCCPCLKGGKKIICGVMCQVI